MLDSILPWLLCVVFLVGGFLFVNNANLRHQNELLNMQKASYELVIKSKDDIIEIQKNDLARIDTLVSKKQTLVIKQQAVSAAIDKIPDTTTNKPFTNPELFDSARILREYQNSNIPTEPTNSNN